MPLSATQIIEARREPPAPRGGMAGSPRPDEVAAWLQLARTDPQVQREWAAAMRTPLLHALEDLRHQPERAARLLAPVIEVAAVDALNQRSHRARTTFREWAAVLMSPRLWKPALTALWTGEPLWQYLQTKHGWFQVTEVLILDTHTQQVVGRAEIPDRRITLGETLLHDVLSERPTQIDDSLPLPHEDSAVRVIMGTRCRLAARVEGLPPEGLNARLQELLREAETLLEQWPQLQAIARAESLQLLQRCLLEHRPSATPWSWRTTSVLTIATGVIILLTLGHVALGEWRWQRALDALHAEPGLHVTSAHSSWGRRELRGLRKETARDPAAVLSAFGIDPQTLVMRFDSYVESALPILPQPHPVSAPRPAAPLFEPRVETVSLVFAPFGTHLRSDSEEQLQQVATTLLKTQAQTLPLRLTFHARADDTLIDERAAALRKALELRGLQPSAMVTTVHRDAPETTPPHTLHMQIHLSPPPAQ